MQLSDNESVMGIGIASTALQAANVISTDLALSRLRVGHSRQGPQLTRTARNSTRTFTALWLFSLFPSLPSWCILSTALCSRAGYL